EVIELGKRSLQFLIPENETFMLTFDETRRHLYVGHALGVYYDQLQDDQGDLFLPSVPGDLFDLNTYKDTIKSINQLNLESLFFNHFGRTNKVDEALNQLNSWLDVFILKTKETINEKGNYNDLSRLLLTEVNAYLEKQGIPDTHQIYQYIILDINTCALTLLNYFKELFYLNNNKKTPIFYVVELKNKKIEFFIIIQGPITLFFFLYSH